MNSTSRGSSVIDGHLRPSRCEVGPRRSRVLTRHRVGVACQGEPVSEHCFVVFADGRRVQELAGAESVAAHWCQNGLERPYVRRGRVELREHVGGRQPAVVPEVRRLVDGSGRDVRGRQALEQRRSIFVPEARLDEVEQFGLVLAAGLSGLEPFVVAEVFDLGRLAEPPPVPVVRDADEQLAAVGLEDVVQPPTRVRRAESVWVAVEAVGVREPVPHPVYGGFEQRAIDALAVPVRSRSRSAIMTPRTP